MTDLSVSITARGIKPTRKDGAACGPQAELSRAATPAPTAVGTPPQSGTAQGLVISATTGRVPDYPPTLRDIWQPRFPRADLVDFAASQYQPLPTWAGEEGPRWRISISPGAVAIGSRDLAKAERTREREHQAHTAEVDMTAAYIQEHGEPPDDTPRSEITEWSRKSRSRMFRTYCELDYTPLLTSPGAPGLTTLTYPDDWKTVVPDGKTAKRHLKAFRKRYVREWGPLYALWKEEFQKRGAPHFHLFMMVPFARAKDGRTYHEWLSQTWADIVGHPDPEQYRKHVSAGTGVDYAEGLRATDPRRIAVYFSKHGLYGAKEYQNHVPPEWQEPGKGPGRFWGYWGFGKRVATVEITPQDATTAARTMRRWARAQGVTRQATVPRSKPGTINPAFVHIDGPVTGLSGVQLVKGKISTRKVRRRVKRLPYGRGWVSVNDGPGFALDIARYLDTTRAPGPRPTVSKPARDAIHVPATITQHPMRYPAPETPWTTPRTLCVNGITFS